MEEFVLGNARFQFSRRVEESKRSNCSPDVYSGSENVFPLLTISY